MLAFTKTQAWRTSSKALFLCAKCSGWCTSITHTTSILGLCTWWDVTVVCPEASLWLPTLSVILRLSVNKTHKGRFFTTSNIVKVTIMWYLALHLPRPNTLTDSFTSDTFIKAAHTGPSIWHTVNPLTIGGSCWPMLKYHWLSVLTHIGLNSLSKTSKGTRKIMAVEQCNKWQPRELFLYISTIRHKCHRNLAI